jgi:hypothetical protein
MWSSPLLTWQCWARRTCHCSFAKNLVLTSISSHARNRRLYTEMSWQLMSLCDHWAHSPIGKPEELQQWWGAKQKSSSVEPTLKMWWCGTQWRPLANLYLEINLASRQVPRLICHLNLVKIVDCFRRRDNLRMRHVESSCCLLSNFEVDQILVWLGRISSCPPHDHLGVAL